MRFGSGALLLLKLDPSSRVPLFRQIYEELRQRMLDRRLRQGARLPSTRALSADLRVSRSTVVQAFEQLRAEGYIESIGRGSTRVSARLPETLTMAKPPLAASAAPRHAVSRPQFGTITDRPARAFRTSVPALDLFPMDRWGRMMMRQWQRLPPAALSYADPRGLPALREAIAAYLVGARGVRCTPDQVLVTSGSQQAFDLVARVLLGPRDRFWMEDPGYPCASGALAGTGARIVHVPVDREGLDVAAGVRRSPGAALAFVTPARQVPLGMTMTLNRRLALVAWAKRADAWILEDDYDSEFRYSTRPLAALQGLDAAERVLFTGTFSKVMFPALRLGYLVVPEVVLDRFARAKHYADFCAPYLSQAVMADFMAEGYFERHIRRMRALYQSRRATLVRILQREFGDRLRVDAPDAGLNLIAWLPDHVDADAASRDLARAGIDVLPLSTFAIREPIAPGFLLGFSGLRDADLRVGVKRLAAVLGPMLTRPTTRRYRRSVRHDAPSHSHVSLKSVR